MMMTASCIIYYNIGELITEFIQHLAYLLSYYIFWKQLFGMNFKGFALIPIP